MSGEEPSVKVLSEAAGREWSNGGKPQGQWGGESVIREGVKQVLAGGGTRRAVPPCRGRHHGERPSVIREGVKQVLAEGGTTESGSRE